MWILALEDFTCLQDRQHASLVQKVGTETRRDLLELHVLEFALPGNTMTSLEGKLKTIARLYVHAIFHKLMTYSFSALLVNMEVLRA